MENADPAKVPEFREFMFMLTSRFDDYVIHMVATPSTASAIKFLESLAFAGTVANRPDHVCLSPGGGSGRREANQSIANQSMRRRHRLAVPRLPAIARRRLKRRIIAFHQDSKGDWVAELDCGHSQHVRHEPPWQIRSWVTTRQGRAERLGTPLECSRCSELGGR